MKKSIEKRIACLEGTQFVVEGACLSTVGRRLDLDLLMRCSCRVDGDGMTRLVPTTNGRKSWSPEECERIETELRNLEGQTLVRIDGELYVSPMPKLVIRGEKK